MGTINYDRMLEAFLNSDASYNGKFYVAVKSTKIYCLPSCTAKQPLEKNILFFDTRDQAILAGFRGCLRCKSEFYPDIRPAWLIKLQKYLKTNGGIQVGRAVLRSISINGIRSLRLLCLMWHTARPKPHL